MHGLSLPRHTILTWNLHTVFSAFSHVLYTCTNNHLIICTHHMYHIEYTWIYHIQIHTYHNQNYSAPHFDTWQLFSTFHLDALLEGWESKNVKVKVSPCIIFDPEMINTLLCSQETFLLVVAIAPFASPLGWLWLQLFHQHHDRSHPKYLDAMQRTPNDSKWSQEVSRW